MAITAQNFSKRTFILAGLLIVVAIAGGVILVFVTQTQKPSSSPTSVFSRTSPSPSPLVQVQKGNSQVPRGPINGIWGTITSINKQQEVATKEEKEDIVATLNVHWDLNRDYQIQVDEDTLVNKYTTGTNNTPPKLLGKRIGWESLKVDDRIYLESRINLLAHNVISPNDVKSINIYPKP